MIRLAVVALATLAATSAAHAGKCSYSSASGLGVTKDIATYMSNKAVKDMIKKNGEKGVGPVKTTCTASFLSTTCISKQKSCK